MEKTLQQGKSFLYIDQMNLFLISSSAFLFFFYGRSALVSPEKNYECDYFQFPCHLGSLVCAVFSCVQTIVYLQMPGIFNPIWNTLPSTSSYAVQHCLRHTIKK